MAASHLWAIYGIYWDAFSDCQQQKMNREEIALGVREEIAKRQNV